MNNDELDRLMINLEYRRDNLTVLNDMAHLSMGELEAIMSAIRELRNPWLKVEDRLPEDNGIFLFAQKSGHIGICRYQAMYGIPWRLRFKYIGGSEDSIVGLTHWKPLPLPPEQEQ